MYRCMLIAFWLCGPLGLAAADAEFEPPLVGTQVTWQEPAIDEGRETRVSQVVAKGHDFAIYLYDISYDVEKPSSYFAEFSGIHVSSCVDEMPTAVEREKLRNLWPLEPGKSLQIGDPDTISTTYEVGVRTVHAVSQIDGERPAHHVTAIVGDIRTDVMVSLDWGTPVLMGWHNGDNARAIELFSPTLPVSLDSLDVSSLGACAQLLQE